VKVCEPPWITLTAPDGLIVPLALLLAVTVSFGVAAE
jgi:hypothetical protein